MGAIALVGPAAAPASTGAVGPLYVEPDQGYAPIDTLLASPKHTLDLTMYELADPTAQQVLIADAARGVTVRVLLDKAYNGLTVNKPAFNALTTGGVMVQWASTQVAITHQKSFVIDGKKAVVMTGNLTSKYYATSRDYSVVDTRTKDVAAIEATFQLDWANTKGTTSTGSGLVWSPGSEAPLVALIGTAKQTLQVENEEMKEPAIVAALVAAAKRGVVVQVVMTDDPDWHANFDTLAAAGVQVRTYKQSTKVLYIHAKTIEVDGKNVFLGSENFTVGSLSSNRELGLTTTTKSIVQTIASTFTKDFAGGTPWV
jgi:phosphatidylserine/phosphatidylglycerophosphate/cardiolipin synthase-like enzyme